jgi:gamma-glutamylcyclotransferase (GGCT)/AIG2-like uncharacterized protein YtfP
VKSRASSVPIDQPHVVGVYGTLRRGERNHGLLDGATFLGTGYVRGTIHHIPGTPLWPYAYPALVLEPPGLVLTELYRLTGAAMLARLDALERYDPWDEAASEYLRIVTEVIDGPVLAAAVYVYNGSGEELGEAITGGDWVAFREERGLS